jgi:hypothetical protein
VKLPIIGNIGTGAPAGRFDTTPVSGEHCRIMRPLLIAVIWIATLGAAFYIGQKAAHDSASEDRVVEKIITITNIATVARAENTAPGKIGANTENIGTETAGASDAAAFIAVTSVASRVASSSEADAILRMKDPAARAQAFARLLAGLSPNNARGIMQKFLANGWKTPRAEEEIRMLAETWAAVDGKSAADYIAGLDHNDRPQNTLRGTLAEWATKDLDAAEAWARAATTNQPNHYMIGVIAGAANVDLMRAQTLLYEMPYGRERGDAMAYVAAAHLENGNADAMTWAVSVPDPRLQQASIRRIASQVALTDPAGAANWVVQNSNQDSLQNNVASIAKEWSFQAPVDAVNWAFSLPAGPAQNAAVSAALPELAQRDPAAAEKILLNQPPTQATDPARISLVREYVGTDPVRALAWANTITDPHAKDHITQRVMETWQEKDPQAAAQFLQPKTP